MVLAYAWSSFHHSHTWIEMGLHQRSHIAQPNYGQILQFPYGNKNAKTYTNSTAFNSQRRWLRGPLTSCPKFELPHTLFNLHMGQNNENHGSLYHLLLLYNNIRSHSNTRPWPPFKSTRSSKKKIYNIIIIHTRILV